MREWFYFDCGYLKWFKIGHFWHNSWWDQPDGVEFGEMLIKKNKLFKPRQLPFELYPIKDKTIQFGYFQQ